LTVSGVTPMPKGRSWLRRNRAASMACLKAPLVPMIRSCSAACDPCRLM